jgi:tRNA dimethylallyltransferase
MALAARIPLAVISADSRQIYRGFDIGTAKSSAADRTRLPHFGIDVADPTERYSAAAWAAAARTWIGDAERAARVPVVVGGTGFYIRALVTPLFVEPVLDPARRVALAAHLAALPVSDLRRWCGALDRSRAHLGRAQLERAIEVAVLSGVAMSRWHALAPGAPERRARYLVVDPGPGLVEHLSARLGAMFDAGWVAEAARLAARVPADAPAWKATGYAIARAMARGEVDRVQGAARVLTATRQYAKRQRTWMRNQLPAADVTVLDPRLPNALDRALEWWTADREGMG